MGIAIEACASAGAPVITLVLGGVRSGKSEVAERLAGPGPGTYLATGLAAPGDEDFADRVARHRARRPAAWATVEEPRAVPAVLARLHGPVLLDALGTWIANDLRPDIDALVAALVSRRGHTVVVSEEVGLGVHPVSEVGRLFADRLGEANRRIAEVADRCILVVAGRTIELPAGDVPGPWAAGSATLAGPSAAGRATPAGPLGTDSATAPGSPGTGSATPPGSPGTGSATPPGSPGTGSATPPGSPGTGSAAPAGSPGTGSAAPPGSPGTGSAAPAGSSGAGSAAPAGTAPPGPSGPDEDGPPWLAADAGSAGSAEERARPASRAAGFRQALSFLTPLGGAASPSQAAFAWFPVVGALLGLVLGVLWSATEDSVGPLAAAALVVAADLGLTGALHFDGLLDSADGLLPHMRAERRLAVMAEPHVGAFAVAAGATALLLRTAALAALGAARPLLLAALWCLSRTAMAVTALTGRYARSHGLASSFLSDAGNAWVAPAAAGAALSLVLAAGNELGSVVALVPAGLAAAGVAALAHRRIGGFTGDTLGAGGVVAETVGLLTAVAVLRP